MTSNDKELLDSLQNISVTHGLVIRGTQIDFLRLLKTLKQDFPEFYIVFQTSSAGKLWIKRGETET